MLQFSSSVLNSILPLAGIQLLLLAFGLVCQYIFWRHLASDRVITYFAHQLGTSAQLATAKPATRARRSLEADAVRASLVVLLSFLGLWFFIRQVPNGLYGLLFSQPMRWIAGGLALYGLVWHAYLGPRRIARDIAGDFRFFDRAMFREFTGPYIVTFGYQIAVVAFTTGIVGAAIVIGLQMDQQTLRTHLDVLANLPLNSAASLEVAAVKLVDFGRWLSTISQKYVVASLFIYVYLAIEQRTALRSAVHSRSVEMVKIGVWIIFILGLGFSFSVLPNYYEVQHSRIFEATVTHALAPNTANDLSETEQLLVVQQYLDQVDMRWLLLRTVTGYGNLFAAALLALAAVIHRLFFSDYPIIELLRIVVPAFIIDWAGDLLHDISLADQEEET